MAAPALLWCMSLPSKHLSADISFPLTLAIPLSLFVITIWFHTVALHLWSHIVEDVSTNDPHAHHQHSVQASQTPQPQHQHSGLAQLLGMHLDPRVAALGFQHPQAMPLGPQAPLEQYLGALQPLEGLAAMPRWDLLVLEQLPHLVRHLPLVVQHLVSQSTSPVSRSCWGCFP